MPPTPPMLPADAMRAWARIRKALLGSKGGKPQIDLSAYNGLRVLIRFNRFKCCGCGNDGWYIDDVALHDACANVILDAPSNITEHSMDLSWSKSDCPDFVQYEIWRSTSPGVNRSCTHIATINDPNVTVYTDTDIPLAGQIYYYRVYVLDAEDMYNQGSNEVSGQHAIQRVDHGDAVPAHGGLEGGAELAPGVRWGVDVEEFGHGDLWRGEYHNG